MRVWRPDRDHPRRARRINHFVGHSALLCITWYCTHRGRAALSTHFIRFLQQQTWAYREYRDKPPAPLAARELSATAALVPESAFKGKTNICQSIWRDPEEKKAAVKDDPTAAARSSIRRRPSIHGNRNRSRVTREATLLRPPPLERSPPPASSSQSRRAGRAGVPPISALLEQANLEPADRLLPPPPPPPVPHSRNYYSLEQRERDIRDGLDSLHARAEQLQRDAQSILSEGRQEVREARTSIRELNRALGRSGYWSSSRPGLRREGSAHALSSGRPRSSSGRPRSQGEITAPRSVLPTPPLDQSEAEYASQPENYVTNRPSHPLSRSWRPDSPINGLGDRDRSLTPPDAWEIMRSTIAPDENLPSADSSFASAAANSSFASAADTTITEPEAESTSESSHRTSTEDDESSESDSVSSVDPDDLACAEDDMISETEQFAQDMYFHEMGSAEGRVRIAVHEAARDREGDRYALAREAPHVDIGFRLIEDALETEEGRARMVATYGDRSAETGDIDRIARFRDRREADQRRRRTRGQHLDSPRSPPPRYSPFDDSQRQEMAMLTSQDAPEPHPVSPPSLRSMNDVGNTLLGDIDDLQDDIQDLEQMRRVVERLASRDDVPDEWWMSMGLNLSRTQVHSRSAERRQRHRSPDGVRRSDIAGSRVVSGRVERETSRL